MTADKDSREGTEKQRKKQRETGLQDELDLQDGDRVRPMLGLANQSPSVAASELARRRLSDCSFATRMTLLATMKKSEFRISKFAIQSFSRRIPVGRNKQAKNRTSASLLVRVFF